MYIYIDNVPSSSSVLSFNREFALSYNVRIVIGLYLYFCMMEIRNG